ncbi:tyrosine-type recombinase/integrase [Histidinibacterium aquaticum]|uniref:Tyrosine-type recombinase/integrase n=1 Tax=Histidinibacterium aquaticum TaxID=2613962 RepID=A0A5J5GD46_9RHOB|nr:site-specific integrase [Histidinibacterium aquaticum]KAA9005947.1 tyrosine-type recombinase/integrase [Histidinibacterium aquaticum]
MKTLRRRLTETFVQSVKVEGDERLEIADEAQPGLRLRVYPTGRKVWQFEKRVRGGPKRKHTLGTYPPMSLKMARLAAQEIALEASHGIDRVAQAAEAKKTEEERRKQTLSVRQVADRYHDLHLSNLSSGDERLRTIQEALREVLDEPVTVLTRQLFQHAIDRKAGEGAHVRANRMKSALSHFGKFLWQRGYLSEHVGVGLANAVNELPRERTPSLEEVRAIYQATFDMGPLWGPLLRLIVLTGQRRSEIAKLRWRDVDLIRSALVYGSTAVKNRKEHIVHLSAPALRELQALRDKSKGELLFTTTGRTPVSGFSKVKTRLDKLLGPDFEPWRFHDIRTGFATAMVEAGEDEAVVDRVLNHSATGSAPSTVARVYNRAHKLVDRRRVLDRWAAMVTEGESVEAATDNVVAMR